MRGLAGARAVHGWQWGAEEWVGRQGGDVGTPWGGSSGGCGVHSAAAVREKPGAQGHPGARGCSGAEWPCVCPGVCGCVSVHLWGAVCPSVCAGLCVCLTVQGCVSVHPCGAVCPSVHAGLRVCLSAHSDAAGRCVRCSAWAAGVGSPFPGVRGCARGWLNAPGRTRGCVPSARGRRLRHRLSSTGRCRWCWLGQRERGRRGWPRVAVAPRGRSLRVAWPRHGQPAGIWQEESESSRRAASVILSPDGQLHGLAAAAG